MSREVKDSREERRGGGKEEKEAKPSKSSTLKVRVGIDVIMGI